MDAEESAYSHLIYSDETLLRIYKNASEYRIAIKTLLDTFLFHKMLGVHCAVAL